VNTECVCVCNLVQKDEVFVAPAVFVVLNQLSLGEQGTLAIFTDREQRRRTSEDEVNVHGLREGMRCRDVLGVCVCEGRGPGHVLTRQQRTSIVRSRPWIVVRAPALLHDLEIVSSMHRMGGRGCAPSGQFPVSVVGRVGFG
jgi:hypothetical protein